MVLRSECQLETQGKKNGCGLGDSNDQLVVTGTMQPANPSTANSDMRIENRLVGLACFYDT